MFTLKMTADEDSSSSILVPFDQKWEAGIRDNGIHVVFRKRGPKTFAPDFIFVYITAPASRLIGRLEVQSFSFMPTSDAAALAESGGLTAAELRNYASTYTELAVFKVRTFLPAPTPLPLSHLASTYGFYPPQSFLRLSESGTSELTKVLGLLDGQKKPRKLVHRS